MQPSADLLTLVACSADFGSGSFQAIHSQARLDYSSQLVHRLNRQDSLLEELQDTQRGLAHLVEPQVTH